MDLAGAYSKQSGLLGRFADLRRHVEADSPRQAKESPPPRSSGGPKKHLTHEQTEAIVAEYEAGVSMAQLKVEHRMAKRTVAKVLREAGVTIRPRGGRTIEGLAFCNHDPAWTVAIRTRRRQKDC